MESIGQRQYDDGHYLFVYTGMATEHQLTQSLRETFIENKIATRFKVAVVVARGQYVGHAYVWIENKEAFDRLMGTDKDGKREMKEIPQPFWEKPTIPYHEKYKEIDEKFPETIDDIKQAKRQAALDKLDAEYVQPKAKVPANPTIKLKDYRYTLEQKARLKKDAEKYNISGDIPEYGSFIISPAHKPTIKDNIKQNVLFCTQVPAWVSEEDLKNIFSPFASDTKTIFTRKVNKVDRKDTYPSVVIIEKDTRRLAYVTFDENTSDGPMACHVCRKLTILEKTSKVNPRHATLIFNHPNK